MRDRFIDGQEKCALRRHLDSVGPDTPIADIVDRCRVWESHEEIDSGRGVNLKLKRPHAVFLIVITDSHRPRPPRKRPQLRRIMNYSPNVCARCHNRRCRNIPTR